jgi:hypothetical protein
MTGQEILHLIIVFRQSNLLSSKVLFILEIELMQIGEIPMLEKMAELQVVGPME